MEESVAIDPRSGNLSVGGFVVTPRLFPSELPEAFSFGPERTVIVLRNRVLCQFSAATVRDQDRLVQIDLRFERNVLVSYFVSFPGAPLEEEHRMCSRWLSSQIGFGGDLARFPWGSAGVRTTLGRADRLSPNSSFKADALPRAA